MLWREYLVSDWKTEKWEFWLHLKEGVPMALTFRLKLWLDLYLYFWPLSILNEWFIFHEKKNWIHATRKMIILMFRCHSHDRFWVCIMPIRQRRLKDCSFNNRKLLVQQLRKMFLKQLLYKNTSELCTLRVLWTLNLSITSQSWFFFYVFLYLVMAGATPTACDTRSDDPEANGQSSLFICLLFVANQAERWNILLTGLCYQ